MIIHVHRVLQEEMGSYIVHAYHIVFFDGVEHFWICLSEYDLAEGVIIDEGALVVEGYSVDTPDFEGKAAVSFEFFYEGLSLDCEVLEFVLVDDSFKLPRISRQRQRILLRHKNLYHRHHPSKRPQTLQTLRKEPVLLIPQRIIPPTPRDRIVVD